MSIEQPYDPPTIKDGTWNPTPGERLTGRLVSITGVAYEFAPTRPLSVLRVAVDNGEIPSATQFVEVHAGLSERLLKEVEAVRPKDGEDIEITVGRQLVDGFPEYVVSAGGRWSVAEHWGPDTIDSRCVFSAAPANHIPEVGERTAVMNPITREMAGIKEALRSPNLIRHGGNPYFKPSSTPRDNGNMAGQLADAGADE